MMFIDESSASKASKTEQMKHQNSILDVVGSKLMDCVKILEIGTGANWMSILIR